MLGEHDVARRIGTRQPATVLPLHPLGSQAIAGFLQLANLCRTHYDMPRAAAALQHLVLNRDVELPRDRWLECAGRRDAQAVNTGNIYFPHLPETSWRLLVKRR